MDKEQSQSHQSAAPNTSKRPQSRHRKLSRLPQTHKIQKRPLLHPPIASARASSDTQKTIYVSARTPFIATVKRLRALLSHVEARATGPIIFDAKLNKGKSVVQQIDLALGKEKGQGLGNGKGKGIGQDGVGGKAVNGKGMGKGTRDEEIVLKATGKAIEKLLSIGVWAQEQEDMKVRFQTRSVGAVDDVVEREGVENGEDGADEVEEESRVRRVSCLEVLVALR